MKPAAMLGLFLIVVGLAALVYQGVTYTSHETVLDLGRKASALTIPVEAVSRKGSESTVLVVGSNDRLEERRVGPGMEGTSRVEALTGIREGDRVVIGNRSDFRVGEQVQPRLVETAPSDGGGNP